MPKRKKLEKIDGLGPHEIKKIRAAVRQVWHRSYARRLCVLRCLGKGGFSYCEKCRQRAPKVFIDHKLNVGDIIDGGIKRMFCSSKQLQGLCKKCHDAKTKIERAEAKRRDAEKGFL